MGDEGRVAALAGRRQQEAQARVLGYVRLAVAALALVLIGVTGFRWGVHDAPFGRAAVTPEAAAR